MDQNNESPMSMSQFRPMIVTPEMSPQLNASICGCRSGCGCGCPGDGNDNGSDLVSDTETAVDFDDSDDEGFAHGEQTHNNVISGHGANLMNLAVHSPRASSSQEIVWFLATILGRLESHQIGEPFLGWEETSFRSTQHEGFGDIVEGLRDGRFSPENRSNAVSGRASVHMASPGPGIGGWMQVTPEVVRNEDAPRVYILTPLRLSAENQHARGKAVEHLVVPDAASVPDLLQE